MSLGNATFGGFMVGRASRMGSTVSLNSPFYMDHIRMSEALRVGGIARVLWAAP
jgi:hypothetical protein